MVKIISGASNILIGISNNLRIPASVPHLLKLRDELHKLGAFRATTKPEKFTYLQCRLPMLSCLCWSQQTRKTVIMIRSQAWAFHEHGHWSCGCLLGFRREEGLAFFEPQRQSHVRSDDE